MRGSMAEVALSDPLRVLIVDDCADTTSTLVLLAGLWGYQPHAAGNAEQALRLAAEHRPHVILLDIGMPGMDGWELAPRLRQLPGLAGVFLIALSGFARTADVRRSYEAGCDLHLNKPFDPERLQHLLAACEKEKRTHDS